MTTIPSN